MIYSSHTFICPFRWSIPADKNKLFSQQINLSRIEYRENSQWVRTLDNEAERKIVYDEKNYFFEFVHPILYDDGGALLLLTSYLLLLTSYFLPLLTTLLPSSFQSKRCPCKPEDALPD